ncbi:unnamed protein product [Phytophthora lilii]|uniref:Unnamed protein product n=1 Tax=Phytophthora lilii TaxID=2077276 RepID=A0A9W6WF64_9STRA|nr:unnamed protein product [Phytophthora lilii]
MSDGQILRTGVLFKKGSGTGPFGRKNWKPRYFVLTPARLQYFTFEDGELKGELSLQGCDEGVLEVMPADSMKTGSSASTIWRIAINAPERRLLVAAGTEMEMNDWVDKLVMAFRINAGQPPMQRASMPAPASANGAMASNVNSNPSIRDFQNFSVPRRGLNQRHSVGAEMRPDEQEMLLHAQAESAKQQQLEEQHRLEEEHRQEELRQEQALRRQEEEQHRQAQQDAEMRRQLAAQQQREQEEAAAQEEAAHAAALAAAEELQRQEEQEKQAQKEREMQKQKELEMQLAMELQRAREAEEAARLQHEQEQEAIRNQRLAEELAMQEKLKPQQGEDLLELQRRQKREEHARQRAEREKAIKLQMQQEQEQEDLAFRMTQQMNSHFSVDDDSDESDNEPEKSPSSPVVASGPMNSGGLNEADAARLSASAAPATAPRSSLVGDVKREMIQKQQLEHQRRREAALKQEQQMRDSEWRQQQVELEQQRAKMEALNVREAPREVEVAPREIEVVRRAPVKKPAAPPAAPMESFEF